jgi:very-short-patch-repair endonuclease
MKSDAREMLTPASLLTNTDGIARTAWLTNHGCTRRALADAVDKGEILRIRRGVFALPGADPKLVIAARHGGALSCADALRHHGIWTLPRPDEKVHVWLGGSGRRRPHPLCDDLCTTHFSPGTARLGYAPVVAALIHAYRCLEPEAFFAAYESAWNQRKISASDRRRIRRELPASAAWMLDLARPDAQSGLESLLRFRLHLLGLTLESQVVIPGVGTVDFVIGRVILEVDGRENHAGADRRHKDLIRDAAASAQGYETLRFDYSMVIYEWDRVLAAILPALARSVA